MQGASSPNDLKIRLVGNTGAYLLGYPTGENRCE